MGSMDMDILDVHTQVFKRFFRLDLSKSDKLTGNNNGTNPAVKKEVVDFHQPVDLLMVDNVSFILPFVPDILVAITAALLLKNTFYIL